jgi:regulator of protease activity HflC (stomatin/prohibitin superfamily)
MWPFVRISIGDQERAVLSDRGRFVRILEPGTYTLFTLGRDLKVERSPVNGTPFVSAWTAYLVKERPELVEKYFIAVETNDRQVAIITAGGRTSAVIAPGCRVLFWRGLVEISAEVIDTRERPEVPKEKLPGILRLANQSQATFAHVPDAKVGILYIDNRFVRLLDAGTYGFWNAAGSPQVDLLDLRRQTCDIPGQEILTKDKVSIRVNISAEYRVVDPSLAKRAVKDYGEYLYRKLQFAVRQSLGRKTLDEILAEKVDLDPGVATAVRAEMIAVGVDVGAIALKDIVLPGDMRDILNQVVTAEKQAQANLIRRREETAATRSLLNTARLLEENPMLVRLKELETLEKLTEKVDRITVTGGYDGLLTELLASGRQKGRTS